MFVELTSETRYGGVDLHTGDLLGVSDLNHGGTVLLCTDMEGVHRKTRGLQGECERHHGQGGLLGLGTGSFVSKFSCGRS